MMAWIESHQALERHPKTLALRKHLDWNLNETLGFLHRFWWWALDAAPDGAVTEICETGVCGDAFGLDAQLGDKAIEGMLKVGWLDRRDDGAIVIHNHEQYRGKFSGIRERARIRQQNRRNRLRDQERDGVTDASRADHGGDASPSPEHDTTRHDTTGNTTQNPSTRSQKETENPIGGLGGGASGALPAPPPAVSTAAQPPGFSDFDLSGSRVRSYADLPWDSLTCAQVFSVFGTLLQFHGVGDIGELRRLVENARVSPCRWVTLFLDKIGYAWTRVDGKIRMDVEEVDPVALTAAGLRPKHGAAQCPTESAGALFREILVDAVGDPDGRGKRWRPLSGMRVAGELEKRKGKRGKR